MQPTLEEAKSRLRRVFLGKGGIHGFGVSRADRCVRVYVSPDGADQPEVLDEVREAAKPFPVTVIVEDRASTT